MGFAITLVRFINEVVRLSAVTYSLIFTLGLNGACGGVSDVHAL